MDTVLKKNGKWKLFYKVFLRAIFTNVLYWGIIFTILQPLFDWITGDKILSFQEYFVQSIFTGFVLGLLETSITYYLVSNVLYKYKVSPNEFEFGKPYSKTKKLYLDIPTVLHKVEKWNQEVWRKFVIKKIDNQEVTFLRGANLVSLQLEYGKVTITSKHRFRFFYIEQGQNIENVELLFLILEH